jgi:uncharacterized protein (TIGR03083 family)
MKGDDVRLAAFASSKYLRNVAEHDWSRPIPELDWSVFDAVAHMIAGTIWYPIDLSAGGARLQTLDIRALESSSHADLILTLESGAAVLAHTIDGSPDDVRGYHPYGRADPSGYAAMGCDEILVHTDDVSRAFGASFVPDDALCERVLRRLFPWAPGDTDAWDTLRWANGRAPLGNHPRLGPNWYWHCAPLEEWDGTGPVSGLKL